MNDSAVSPYTLSERPAELMYTVFSQLNIESEIQAIKTAFDRAHAEVLEKTLDYMKDEYSLRFEEAAQDQARLMVEALLKGDEKMAEAFNLKSRVNWMGEEAAYDTKGILESIVKRFAAEIQNAEIIILRAEVEHLRGCLDSYRDR